MFCLTAESLLVHIQAIIREWGQVVTLMICARIFSSWYQCCGAVISLFRLQLRLQLRRQLQPYRYCHLKMEEEKISLTT